uniref:Endothelial cell adhesion molecule a n=1 Tax=Oryzias latipes TaxID=8090 RepID=A0A3B3HX95_ORYLA
MKDGSAECVSMELCRKVALLSLLCLWELSGLKALTSIDVVRGAQVELKASSNSNIEQSGSTVIWNFISDSIVLVISYNKGSTVYGSQFKGRVGFVNQMPSQDVSLMINKTLESDSGRYACQVITSGTVPFVTEFSLNVKVPPSPPNCSVIGTPTLRGNVTLSCMSSEGKPAPLYHWKKTKPKTEIFFPPMQNSEAGTLKLTNLSSNMTGLYVCTANNTVGSANCSINLEIISTNKVGMIVGATVGSVLGFIFLIFILIGFLVVFKKRSYVEDDMANEIKEDAQAPKRVSWAKSGMGSDVISKNGTLSSIASSPHHRGYSRHHDSHHQQPRHPASDTADDLLQMSMNWAIVEGRCTGWQVILVQQCSVSHLLDWVQMTENLVFLLSFTNQPTCYLKV